MVGSLLTLIISAISPFNFIKVTYENKKEMFVLFSFVFWGFMMLSFVLGFFL